MDILALHRIYSGEQYWAKPRCAHISLTRANWLMGFDIFVGQCSIFGKSINRSQLPRTEASGGKKIIHLGVTGGRVYIMKKWDGALSLEL